MTTITRSDIVRHSRAAMALSLAALAPGLGHLTLGQWIKGVALFVANIGSLMVAGAMLAAIAPNHATMSSNEVAATLAPDQLLVLAGLTCLLIGCIVYSVRDVKRILRDR